MRRMELFRQLKLAALALLCLSNVGGSLFGNEAQEADIARTLTRLKHIQGIENWTLTSDDQSIQLLSNFKIPASSSQAVATVDDENATNADNASEMSISIRIQFIPFVSYDSLTNLKSRRDAISDKLNRDSFDLEAEPLSEPAWMELQKSLRQIPDVTHVAGETLVSITSDLDNPDLSFEPTDELKETVWMLYRLGFLFSEIKR